MNARTSGILSASGEPMGSTKITVIPHGNPLFTNLAIERTGVSQLMISYMKKLGYTVSYSLKDRKPSVETAFSMGGRLCDLDKEITSFNIGPKDGGEPAAIGIEALIFLQEQFENVIKDSLDGCVEIARDDEESPEIDM